MFFTRLGPDALTPETTPLTAPAARPRRFGRRARQARLAALALAATMALPVGAGQFARLYAQDAPPAAPAEAGPADATGAPAPADAAPAPTEATPADTAAQMDPRDVLAQGVQQYKDGQYEEAVDTLQQITAGSLSGRDQKQLEDTLGKAQQAAESRRTARAEFEQGEQALSNNQPGAAIEHYKRAADNKYADPGTRDKAKQQIAVAQDAQKNMQGEMKATYEQAKADYKAKNYAEARTKFQSLVDAGYKPGLFAKKPAAYLEDINKRIGSEEQAAPEQTEMAQAQPEMAQPEQPAAPQQPETAPPPAPAPTPAPVEPTAQAPAQPAPAPEAPAQPTPPPAVAAPEQQPSQPTEAQAPQQQDPVAQANALVQQAAAAQQENNLSRAYDLYSQAYQLDPNNAQAKAGRDQLQPLVGRAGTGEGLLARQAPIIQAEKQDLQYTFDTSINNAEQAIASGKFDDAQAAVDRARVARDTNPRIFTEQEVASFDSRLATIQQRLDTARREAQQQQLAQEQADVQKQIQMNRERTAEERRRTVATLTTNARNLIDERRYEEAIGVLDQITTLDPTNDYAIGVRQLVEDRAVLQEQRRLREDWDRQFEKQLNRAEESKIPYDDILRYPENWPDISEVREQSVALERGVGTVDQQVQQILDRRLPEVRFDNIGFADVIDFLRDITGANIFVNWRALEGAGIDRAAPVTARLRDVRFSKALDTILRDVGGGTVELTYTIDEGVITISTSEDLSRNTLTQVYDIRDLIIDIPDFNQPPDFQIQASQTGRGGGSGGQSLFQGNLNEEQQGEGTRGALVDQIIQLIEETVAPDSWREAGGSVGAIRELSGQLIVTQTPENQRALSNLLQQLRETRAIQVTIETRFLTVQRNFLEDVGVDADFIFNLENPDKFSPVEVNQDSFVFTANPSTGVPGSISNVNPGGSANPIGGAGMQISGTYLDNFAVSLLIRATQASQKSSLLTAPRITLFNGQRAFVVVATETAYVSDLDPIVGQRSVAFDPQIGLVQSGVLLDVQATVSSDRKYVTLTLRPTLSRLVALVPFTFQTAAQTTTTQPSGGGGNTVINQESDAGIATGIVQQPIRDITSVNTTVSVPDGGTLLLGGQTLAGEIEREAGVPVLSKIPFLKRLFTNRSMAKDEQVLLILVKPTIIIQREQEQRQFPTLGSRVGG